MAHTLFVVSDATGETGERVLRAALVQFPGVEVEIERFGGVRERGQMQQVVTLARQRRATILHTLVSHDLRAQMISECRRQAVEAWDLMGPALDRLAESFRMRPQEQPGMIEQLREARTRVIEAVDFAFLHDDGQNARDFDRAEQEFRTAIDLNPYLPRTYHFYARERVQRGSMQTAAELFRKSADLDPLDYQSRCLRVQVLQGLGEFEQARSEAREAIATVERHMDAFPDDPSAFNLGALALIQVDEKEQAMRWLQRALEIDPDDPIVLYNAACGFALLGIADTALDYLERAVAHGTISLDWMRNDSDLASIREDCRYIALTKRLADGGMPAQISDH